mmetsp:Transcript_13254/g.34754  ORF Transcript_13254/g.34754 Transcript_13254/m.34754 type:complete len:86 (-) Transcript_13254:1247-1504(-)
MIHTHMCGIHTKGDFATINTISLMYRKHQSQLPTYVANSWSCCKHAVQNGKVVRDAVGERGGGWGVQSRGEDERRVFNMQYVLWW